MYKYFTGIASSANHPVRLRDGRPTSQTTPSAFGVHPSTEGNLKAKAKATLVLIPLVKNLSDRLNSLRSLAVCLSVEGWTPQADGVVCEEERPQGSGQVVCKVARCTRRTGLVREVERPSRGQLK